MATGRNPSGLPRQRIVGPMWGPREVDVYRRVGSQHEGLLRVRRTLLIVTGVLATIAAIGMVASGIDTAFGVFAILLAPLLLILAVLQVIVALTRPKDLSSEPGADQSG